MSFDLTAPTGLTQGYDIYHADICTGKFRVRVGGQPVQGTPVPECRVQASHTGIRACATSSPTRWIAILYSALRTDRRRLCSWWALRLTTTSRPREYKASTCESAARQGRSWSHTDWHACVSHYTLGCVCLLLLGAMVGLLLLIRQALCSHPQAAHGRWSSRVLLSADGAVGQSSKVQTPLLCRAAPAAAWQRWRPAAGAYIGRLLNGCWQRRRHLVLTAFPGRYIVGRR